VTEYRATIEDKPGYVHATVTGERTPENALRFLREVTEACARCGKEAALLEMRFTGASLDATSIFQVISERSPSGARLRRIAYVQATGDPQKARFAETVAVNRGVNVRLFDNVADAEKWLAA
jgi:chromosome condensin MukBEF MukE localization factor